MLGEIVEMIGEAVADAVGSAVMEPWNRRRRRRLQARGRLRAALRATEGTIPGLSRRWRHGRWSVEDGRLTRRSTVVHVVRLDGPPRTPSVRESLAVDPGSAVFRVITGQGEVEIAVLSEQADWFLDRLGVAPGERRTVV